MAGRKRTVSDEELLRVFEHATDPVLSAPEVADHVSIGEKGVYQRLRVLQQRGLLDSKKIGQGRAWWLTDAGVEMLSQNR